MRKDKYKFKPNRRRHMIKISKTSAVFDEDERKNFLHSIHGAKKRRRDHYLKTQEEQLKQEKKTERAQKNEFLNNKDKQQVLKQNFEKDQQPIQNPPIQKVQEEKVKTNSNQKVTITKTFL